MTSEETDSPMSNRITIYGKQGDKQTERLLRELRSMSLTYDFTDTAKQPSSLQRLHDLGIGDTDLPRVEISCAYNAGSVFLTNPDTDTLRQTLYAEEVLGVTSYWV